MINPNPNHISQPSFLPPNIILAMIDVETDTNDYDQVSVSVQPPTLIIPSQNERSEGSSDNDFPPPPSTSLKSVPLTTPLSSKNHHYDDIDTRTTVTTTVTKTVDPPKNKSKEIAICCLLLLTAIVSALVLLLVFGWHEKLSFGDIGKSGENGTEIGQGNLTMNSFFTDMVNNTNTHPTAILAKTIPTILPTDSWISTTPSLITPSTTHLTTPTTTSPSTTSSTTTTTPTTITTTTSTTTAITFPFGWREPIKNVTAEPYIQPFDPFTTTSAPTTTITTFEEKDKNVFGNMSIFLSDKNRFVVSPFLLNYILSYIGKFGDFSTKSAIADKYFGGKTDKK
uniref:Uncharacterized protein n=1 Tax=Panagrolaimus davidi TaxID=227884 RepID=A0A914PQP3_9BILA